MTIKNSTRLLATVLTLAMMLSFVACNFYDDLSGSLALESFIIDPNSYKAEYTVGEEVDFSGIKAIVKYNDETLNKTYTAADLTISYDKDMTATVGQKEVTISFTDPHLNVKQEVKITIQVVEKAPEVTTPEATTPEATTPEVTTPEVTTPEVTTPEVTTPEGTTPEGTTPEGTTPEVTTPEVTTPEVTTPETTTPAEIQYVVEFHEPTELSNFNDENEKAGQLSYGQDGFQGQFAVGGQLYVIGNQNEFKFKPTCSVWNASKYDTEVLDDFFADVVISVKNGDTYTALTTKKMGNNVVEYYNGDVLIATVNTYKGTYQFTANAADKVVKISVEPAEAHYSTELPAVEFEAKIINAYNVYEAWQLAVIDNVNAAWTDIKTAKGIADLTVSGIVLHKDIHLTANDVPASFFYTTTAPVVYTNSTTGATIEKPAGTKYLVDGTFIYERLGTADFVIEGNFFTLDTKDFPIVPSPAVFGADAERDYGTDFSNAALFKFRSADDWEIVGAGETPADVSEVTINNLALIGNSARDNLLDATDNLASAGGLIFLKSSYYTQTKLNNVIGNSYFITYFCEHGDLYVNDSKCYDSYQNAAFIWGDSEFELTNSYLNGCGGPAIIAQSLIEEGRHPVVNVTGGQIETHLSGSEIWFTAVNATAMVNDIKLLGMGLQQAGLGNIADADGKMNIMSALMAKGSRADEIVTGISAQGSVLVDGKGIDRFISETNVNWTYIYNISQVAMQAGQVPPFFTVTGADGAAYTIYYNGTTFVDFAGNALGTDASHAAIVAAFMQAETVVLTQGGLSVVFEFYHY